jgi:hypothetical protein
MEGRGGRRRGGRRTGGTGGKGRGRRGKRGKRRRRRRREGEGEGEEEGEARKKAGGKKIVPIRRTHGHPNHRPRSSTGHLILPRRRRLTGIPRKWDSNFFEPLRTCGINFLKFHSYNSLARKEGRVKFVKKSNF